MVNWWEGLSNFEKMFATFAVPATVVLTIQTILLILGLSGFGDGDTDYDGDFDTDFDADQDFDALQSDGDINDISGLRLFTVRGFVAFFAVFGWTGITLSKQGVGRFFTMTISFIMGFLVMFLLAFMIKWALKLETKGNINNNNAIGKSASVYIKIPPNRKGVGKVTLVLQSRFVEMDAITDEDEEIFTNEEVLVVGVTNRGVCIVKRK